MQMRNRTAPTVQTTTTEGVVAGSFFRVCGGDGGVFFMGPWGSEYTAPYPVMENGTVSIHMEDIHYTTPVEVVKQEDLGISEIKRSCF